jgi:membrane associated rhomboid family serine protease
MKSLVREYFWSQHPGARLLLLIFALAFPVHWIGHRTGAFELYDWLDLCPALVWHGEVWRLGSYAFLGGGVVDWVVSLFWLATLVPILARIWSARTLWTYCLVTALAGALPVIAILPGSERGVVGASAMIFGLLVAWYRLYGRERLLLLGIGELSVRQAAILIAVINSIILLFCAGWFLLLAMWCGGVAGWIYLALSRKLLLSRDSRRLDSERIARLEL